MIDLADSRWAELYGGYRTPYDPRAVLRVLEEDRDPSPVWKEFWEELHHQGDVGDASYAAVIALVDIQKRRRSLGWQLYALASTIEIARHRKTNPSVPEWLSLAYRTSWRELLDLALEELPSAGEDILIQATLAVVAIAKGQLKLGALLEQLDPSELDELLEDRLAWSELYRDGTG
jgi:hypothetical protein